MFDYTLLHWTTFLTAAVLLNLSPGPDMAFILGQTVRGGQRAGFAAMAGVWLGALCHVGFAALGLTAILATSAIAFSMVKWAGAAYLIWIGISALRSRGEAFLPGTDQPAASPRRIIRQGILISLLNPKVAIFFLAFLPQFVVPGEGPVTAQLALHGVLIIAVAAVIEPPLVLLGGRLTAGMRANPRIGLWIDRTLGALLVSLGLKLALSDR